MDQLKAMERTLEMAQKQGFDSISFDTPNIDFHHLTSMYSRAKEGNFSEAKLGRWLGYMQGVLVSQDCLTLDNCKKINESFSNDWTHHHIKRGTKYKIVGQARAQCNDVPIKDGDMLTLYVGEDGVYSVRHPAEFGDGRFERITPSEMPTYDKME